MSATCEKCRVTLSESDAFCTHCGARRDISHAPPAPEAKSSGIPKAAIAGVTIVLLFVTAIAGLAYVVRHVRQKPARVQMQSNAEASTAAPTASVDAKAFLKQLADLPEPTVLSVDRTADVVGNSPAAMFTYVREHVRTQIYSGVLRGARGTLISGAGNSWDQALLLASMLRHHGRDVRFARVHLAPEIAARVVDRMFLDAARPRAPTSKPLQIPESLKKRGQQTLAQIHADWEAAQADVLQALNRASLSLGDTAVSDTQLEAEAADHLFVEYQEGDRWIALDPIIEDAPGASVPSAAGYAPEIPDSFFHHVTIRVWMEERHGQALQQQEVFRFPTTAAALSGAQVLLWHRLDHDAVGGWRATPVLQIDGKSYVARTFSASGLIAAKANSKEDAINQAQKAISQVGPAAAMFGGDNKKTAVKATSATPQGGFTAESLEVKFSDPAKHSEVVRRELIDRIGPVARANKTAATAPLTLIDVVHRIPVQLAGVHAMAFATGPLDAALLVRRVSSAESIIDARTLTDTRPTQNGSLSPEDQQRAVRDPHSFPALLQGSAEGILLLRSVCRGIFELATRPPSSMKPHPGSSS